MQDMQCTSLSGQTTNTEFILLFNHSENLRYFSYKSLMRDPYCGIFSHGFLSAPLFLSPKGLTEDRW